ncbi:MAG: maltose/maltodextrin ABC transporter substrate-binding protein MalE [Ruminobacter sp.]|nr:maltose/maltodextrin ABC transporter substrate-binding protein MalE [Ruminobacter sp.]
MNKLIFNVAAGIAALGLIQPATAAEEPANTSDENRLVIWVNGDKPYNGISKVGEAFEKDTGIKVIVAHPDDVSVRFQQYASMGSGPDIYTWAHDQYGELVSKGLIDEITPSKELMAKFYPKAWEAMQVNGKYYGYPISMESTSLLCNKKLAPKAPKTFEELVALDDNLRQHDKRAILWDYRTPYFSYPLFSANGGYAFKKGPDGVYNTKDTGVNNEGSQLGLRYLVELIIYDHMQKGVTYDVMKDKFASGDVACIIDGPWGWGNYSSVDFSVNPLPALRGKKGKPLVGVLGMTINVNSRKKAEAQKFITEYLLTDKGYQAMVNDRILGAVALKSFEKKLEASDPRVAVTMQNATIGDLMPNVFEMSRYWGALHFAIINATTGRKTVQDALKEAEEQILR